MASFSVMIGRSTTIKKNQQQKPVIHSKVFVRLMYLGGSGSGFDLKPRDTARLERCSSGTGGRGFECGSGLEEPIL